MQFLTFVFGVFSTHSLLQADENDLLTVIGNFTDLPVELHRIPLSEQCQMGREFLEFLTAYRRVTEPAGNTTESSAINLLRC